MKSSQVIAALLPPAHLRFIPSRTGLALRTLFLLLSVGTNSLQVEASENSDAPFGWASTGGGTTGGDGGAVVVVSLAEGLISHLQRPEPLTILVEGTIDLSGPFPGYRDTDRYDVASNKTILGIGSDAAIINGELRLSGVSNVTIRNLAFSGSPGTTLAVTGGTRYVWIDHNNFTESSDGLVDVSGASDFVTISWNRFFDHNKVSLVGAGDEHTDDRGHLRVTYHHNWFSGTNQRHPRVRYGKVHVFNNLYDYVTAGIGIGVEAEIISERNFFSTSTAYQTYFSEHPDRPGFMRDTGSAFTSTHLPPPDHSGITWTPRDHYSYLLHDIADVPHAVKTGSGVGVIEIPELPPSTSPIGLVAYYPLAEQSGTTAADRSGFDPPLDLDLSGGASWLNGRKGVSLDGGQAKLQTVGAATKLFDRITKTRQLTVEAWAKPGHLNQQGARRLVSYSQDFERRNFTLGHGTADGLRRDLVFRIRTTGRGDRNGLPEVVAPLAMINGVSHYVSTFDGTMVRTYRNGELIYSEAREGFLLEWDPEYPLILGNEATGDRGWHGELYTVGIFDRSLSETEIRTRFQARKHEFEVGVFRSFEEWMAYAFPVLDLTDPALAGPAGDPDGRGLPLLLRYALGVDPLDPKQEQIPQVFLSIKPDNGKNHLTLIYDRRKNLPDVAIQGEVSSDLLNWSILGDDATIAVFPHGDLETVIVQDPEPIASEDNRFIRVRATLDEN